MQRRLKILGIFLIIALVCMPLAACGKSSGTPEAETKKIVNLKIADTYPPTAVNYKVMTEIFIPALEGSGQFKVTYYPGGEIGKAEDMLELVRGGTTDIAYVSPGFVSGALPLSSVFTLPMEFNADNAFASEAVWELLKREPLKSDFEKQGVKPIYLSMNPASEIFTSAKQVKVPKDLKGMIIRGGGGDANETLNILGASVVSIATNDLYEAMQRKTIEGMSYNFGSLVPYSLHEVSKYATDGIDLGSLAAIYFINIKTWNSLTPEQQKIIEDAGLKAVKEQAARYKAEVENGKKKFAEAGGTIHVLTAEEKALWAEALKPATEAWIKRMETRGETQARKAYEEMQAVKKAVSGK